MTGFWVVTGASKGIGRALVNELLERDFNVIATSRESPQLDTLRQIDHVTVIPADLTLRSDVESLCSRILELDKPIQGMIHNAGRISPIDFMHQISIEEWSENIEMNLISVQHMTQLLWPRLQEAKRSRIVTISSGASIRALHSWSAYCVSKAGLDMWAKAVAVEGQLDGISAISIAPGIVNTAMQETIRDASDEKFPLRQTFQNYFDNGDLSSPQEVAQKLIDLILHHPMEQTGMRFDIRDL
jgi:benzil reductase ((S)-benzoin forming)